MAGFIELKQHILDSIWLSPCTLNELCKRDFLKNISTKMVDRLLMQLKNDNKIYMKGEVYYSYKKHVSEENL